MSEMIKEVLESDVMLKSEFCPPNRVGVVNSAINAISADSLVDKDTGPHTVKSDVPAGVVFAKGNATVAEAGLMSSGDKIKLDEIEIGATSVIVEDSLESTSAVNALSANNGRELNERLRAEEVSPKGDMFKEEFCIKSMGEGKPGMVDNARDSIHAEDAKSALEAENAKKVNGHTVGKDVPVDAMFTDTTYGVVTETKDGLMSKEDFNRLRDVKAGATNVKVQKELTKEVYDDNEALHASIGKKLSEKTNVYVVESKQSITDKDIWRYRTWSDGTVEAWCSNKRKSVDVTTRYNLNNIYYASLAEYFPFKIYNAVPSVNVRGGAGLESIAKVIATDEYVTYFVCNDQPYTATDHIVYVHVIGTLKP